MKVLQIGFYCAVLASLLSCSTLAADGKRIDYGAAALQVPSLEIPPDLTMPSGDDYYKVPQNPEGVQDVSASTAQASAVQAPGSPEGIATYSDYSKGGLQNRAASPLLPSVPGVHMERNNVQRWLVINDKAENVWPEIKSFWQEIGLPVSSEDLATGVMETRWAENHAVVAQGGSSNGFNQEFSTAHSVGERDQYRTRLERGKDGKTTEVYITHRGIKEEFSAAKGASQWVARANDPELEAIMLKRLMMRFGVSKVNASNAVATTPSVAANVTVLNPSEPLGLASLREVSAGETVIIINDAFDRSWRKVGLAIESAGLSVEDKDREKGVYYLRPVKLDRDWLDKLKFWKNDVDTSRHYRVQVKDGGTSSVVSIVDQEGASNKVSKQMLRAIYKQINQQQ
jgi:outer membrane protein assembly factor BamC